VFCVFHSNRWPWRQPRQYNIGTQPMAASNGFEWSPVCDSLVDAPRIISPHRHGNQNHQHFNHFLSSLILLLPITIELKPRRSVVHWYVISLFVLFGRPAVNDGCYISHYLKRRARNLKKIQVVVAPLANPFGWLPKHRNGAIHWINAIGGTNGTPWWWCLWGELFWCSTEFLYHLYYRKSMEREVFVPVQTQPNPTRG